MADLSALPQCGLTCLVSSLSASTCAPTDTACLCADQGFANVVTSCVTSNCTIRQSLVVKNYTASNCGLPEPNHDATLVAITVVLITLQTIFFALRMLCRAVRIAPWGWDDTTIVLAFILTTSFAGASVLEGRTGLGKNVWTLSPDDINEFLKIFYAFEAIYTFVLGIVKISICFLYIRIFPGPRIQFAVWATQVFNVVLIVGYIIADGFQCRPISFFWEGWDREHEGSCWNLEAFVYSHGVINIVLDVWMLALPASQIWKLNLPMKRKIGVFSMFGFGILLTIISAIRLVYLNGFSTTTNPTMDFYSVGVWTAVEITAGLMVACMPAARLFVVHCAARLFTSYRSRISSEPHPPRSGNSNRSRAWTLSRRLQTNLRKSSSSKKLHKNRRHSTRVTVTSTESFDHAGSEDLQLADEGSRAPEFLEQPRRLSPFGERFTLPEESLTPNESRLERPGRIWAAQHMNSDTRAPRSQRQYLQDEKADVETGHI